jgi:hypothetical protein
MAIDLQGGLAPAAIPLEKLRAVHFGQFEGVH